MGSNEPLPLEPVRQEDLANFQLDAVRRGLDMIRRHNGCYIADVVGLGKTFIGAELLRQLRQSYPNEGNALIICPAGLVPMWNQFNERYQLGATDTFSKPDLPHRRNWSSTPRQRTTKTPAPANRGLFSTRHSPIVGRC